MIVAQHGQAHVGASDGWAGVRGGVARLTAECPAPLTALLELMPPTRRYRGIAIVQSLYSTSLLVRVDGRPAAIQMFAPTAAPGTVEYCLAITPAAVPFMRRLVRLAHSTLAKAAQSGVVVVARVDLDNRAGHRMALLAGFQRVPGEEGGRLWRWEG